ncbi:putative ATP:guanido phosphotransferase [Chitinispirillum alkaliphilum]|nr:putative ATP:guanido phosphotransferase [Chitinispirillum alkaliphilum]
MKTQKTSQKIALPVWFDNKGPESDVVISTRVRLARNIAGYNFPHSALPREKKEVFKKATEVFPNCQGGSFDVINLTGLEKLEQYFLAEQRVVSREILNVDGDRGVVCDPLRRVNVMINEEDHLRLQCMDSGFRAQELWGVLDALDDSLGQKLPYAYDKLRGFLTCCPTNSGTGLRVSYLLHLPGLVLTKTIDQVLQGASQMGIATRGFLGEHSDVLGNFFQLSNQATMGSHEQEFLDSTQKVISEIILHERLSRERVMDEAEVELSDKVHRSYGLLTHARTLSMSELLNLCSALRLGIECSVLEDITIEELNRIICMSMPAHIQIQEKKEMEERELSVVRADLVRDLLAKRRRRRKTSQSK